MEIKEYINKEIRMLDKGLVATPTEQYLNDFLNANNGSNDFLLTQMAKNYGYKLALLNMLDTISKHNTNKD